MKLLQNPKSFRHGKEIIPYSRQWVTRKDISRVVDCLNSDWIAGTGPLTERFERELAEVTGYRYALVVNSGTTALYIAISQLGSRDLVEIPALTFVATANAVKKRGCRLSLCDIDRTTLVGETWGISVDYAGYPATPGAIIDASHSLRPAMATSETACVSFHATKNSVVSGEGGAVLTNDEYIYQLGKSIREHGFTDKRETFAPSLNFRLPDFCVALARSQLEELEKRLDRRRQIARYYLQEFATLPVELPATHSEHTWHLFVLRVDDRDGFRERLLQHGIETQVHYLPIYRHPFYAVHLEYTPKDFPITEEAYSRIVSIPIWCGMTDEMVDDVVKVVKGSV